MTCPPPRSALIASIRPASACACAGAMSPRANRQIHKNRILYLLAASVLPYILGLAARPDDQHSERVPSDGERIGDAHPLGRRHHPQARPPAPPGRRAFPRDVSRSVRARERPLGLDRDLLPARAWRTLALAPDRCRRDMALLRGRAAG